MSLVSRLRAAAIALGVLFVGAGGAHAVSITPVKTPSGIEAWLVEDHSLPVIAIEFSFDGGAALDPAGQEGRANLAVDLLDEGAGDLDAQAYKRRLEDLAVRLEFSAEMDTVGGTMRTLTANADGAFELLRLALASPRFDATAIERVKSQLEADLREDGESPRTMASRAWWRTAFPDHPYGRRAKGTLATIAKLDAADFRRFVAERFARGGLKIGVVGDITPDRLAALLDRTFAALPSAGSAAAIPEASASDAGALLVVRRSIPQSVVVFGSPGIKRDDPDWYAAYVMNEILAGSGLTSRLSSEIREKRGLAYGVSSGLSVLRHGGVIIGQVATRNDRVAEMLDVLRGEWRRFRDQGPTEAELAAAKKYLIGSFPLGLDSTARIARLLITLQEDGLGIDYLDRRAQLIGAVGVDDVRRVAKRLLDPDRLRIVVVGAPKELPGAQEIPPEGS
jgi:zinc protease